MAMWMWTKNYTKGRSGYSIVAIVPHISCCSSIGAIDNTFGPYSSRKVSTHYAVSDSVTHQYVSESDTAWSVGNWPWNCKTISIEHVGTTANPPSKACLDRGAQLMADIAYRMGWKKLTLGSNVRLHREFASTACPANMDYQWEIARANVYLAAKWAGKKKEEKLYYPGQVKKGSKGNAVAVLQGLLNMRNGAGIKIDADFGSYTEKCVKAWQTKVGLYPDGICGAKTWPTLLGD